MSRRPCAVDAVLTHSRARLADRLVLLVIAQSSTYGTGSGCRRGRASIAKRAGVNVGSVTRSLRTLEELGELHVERRPGRPSRYTVTLPGLLNVVEGGAHVARG